MKNNNKSFYSGFIKDLTGVCCKKNIGLKVIGHSTAHKIYRLMINPRAKINFCIAAGVHGDEIAGPLAILDLLNNKKYLDRRVKYFIYPMISPSAFDLGRRRNAAAVDLNVFGKKTLADKRYAEAKIFYEDVCGRSFAAFLSLHEDLDEKRFYSYVFEKRSVPQIVYRQIVKEAGRRADIWRARSIHGAKSDRAGLIINHNDRSIEQYMFNHGGVWLSFATETPGKLDLAVRRRINLGTIGVLSRHMGRSAPQ
ncbi:MAG: succinylglutamate desuccinylase/aspartoacylase family protein [Candidatus Niyogibacteria bacterium]|nr:succinylglutamate desuccinylase/aspartoacylase family protein [Candidatus Niyogibacteria bacterium]